MKSTENDENINLPKKKVILVQMAGVLGVFVSFRFCAVHFLRSIFEHFFQSFSPPAHTLIHITKSDMEPTNQVLRRLNRTSSSTTHLVLTSTSLARIPLSCAIRRSFRLAVARHRLQIATLAFITLSLLYARSQYAAYTAAIAAVPNLVSLTLDRLATQAALNAQDKESYPESWISIGQLRDDVLRDEHSVSKREKQWQRVRKVVEKNANVRASQREGRSGEVSRVWEWIGAVSALEDAIGSGGRRKSGRVSWGAYGEASSPVSGTDGGPEMVQAKWQEGRPIY